MRSAADIKKLIIDFAINDERIRAVLLSGSRADPHAVADKFQDFDVSFIVNDLKSFTRDHQWTGYFGKKIIMQLPNEMSFGSDPADRTFGYLMLFTDGNRIDLTLVSSQDVPAHFKPDSQTIVWVDKDDMFLNLPEPSDKDHWVRKPSEKEFADVCNEFWWVSTYVVKGLARNQLIYAKSMLETVVRPMFLKMIEWKIGCENNFSVSVGTAGKKMQKYLAPGLYERILATYSNAEPAAIRTSLISLTDLFDEVSKEVGERLGYNGER